MSAARGTFASTSRESDSEFPRKVVSREHVFFFVYSLSHKTEIAKYAREPKFDGLLARRRTGEAPLLAEKFGDLITADHKVLNEECESRNSNRYAVVVQDLAIQ